MHFINIVLISLESIGPYELSFIFIPNKIPTYKINFPNIFGILFLKLK